VGRVDAGKPPEAALGNLPFIIKLSGTVGYGERYIRQSMPSSFPLPIFGMAKLQPSVYRLPPAPKNRFMCAMRTTAQNRLGGWAVKIETRPPCLSTLFYYIIFVHKYQAFNKRFQGEKYRNLHAFAKSGKT